MQTSSVLTIFGMALLTYATRAGGFWLIERVKPTPFVEKWLRHIPGAILVSIVAPIIIEGSPSDLVAVAVTIGVGITTKNVLLTMIVGIGVVVFARNFI